MASTMLASHHHFSSQESSPEPEPDWDSVVRPNSPPAFPSSSTTTTVPTSTSSTDPTGHPDDLDAGDTTSVVEGDVEGEAEEERRKRRQKVEEEEEEAVSLHYRPSKPIYLTVTDPRREGRKGSYVTYLISSSVGSELQGGRNPSWGE